ncbi:MAG: membrane dipeptidase, partial [bacterium]
DRFSELSEEEREKAHSEWDAVNKKYPPSLPSISDFVDHIDHIVKVVGIEHVGIGSDFDGGGQLEGCQDVSDYSKITKELIKRDYTEEEIKKIWGGNLMRVFRKVESVAENMKN